jgi:hypothetical protein
VLGVHFAMYSGTMDSVIYDTVLEETGSSGAFERRRRDLVDRVPALRPGVRADLRRPRGAQLGMAAGAPSC